MVERAAIYARVSTDEQKEGQTIDPQIAELERTARSSGCPIVGVYKDEGWSGALLGRPALDQLRDDARNGLFDVVLVNDVDRLARDVVHLGIIRRDLEKSRVRLKIRNLPSESTPANNLMVNIMGSFAEFERELIVDRTRRGRRHKVEVKKQYLGSNTVYGLRYVRTEGPGRTGHLIVVPEEAHVIQQIYRWVADEGITAGGAARRLTSSGIRAPKGGSKWHLSSILNILRNETYTGRWHYNKTQAIEPPDERRQAQYRRKQKSASRRRHRHEWLPLELDSSLHIVPRDLWERAQSRLTANLVFSPRNEKHVYLLKSLVKCGACGATYVGNPSHGYFSYRCVASCKRMQGVKEATLDHAVLQAVRKIVLDPELILEPLRKIQKQEKAKHRTHAAEINSVEQDLQRIDREEQRILEAYRLELITPSQLGGQLAELNTRREGLQTRTAELQAPDSIPIETSERTVADYCAEAARNLDAFTNAQWRELLRTMIDSIVFEGDRIRIQGRIPADQLSNDVIFVKEVPVNARRWVRRTSS